MDFTKKIEDEGIVKIKGFLNNEELKMTKNIIGYYSVPKNHHKSYFSTNVKHLFFKVLKLNFRKLFYDIKILNLAKNKKLNDIASKFFKKKSYLNFIDGYHTPISEKDVLPWHTDQAYRGAEKKLEGFVNPDHSYLKFFIYLTDVNSDNGCMSYIPKSHKLGYAIRKGIYEKKIDYQPYWRLEDFRNFILNKKNFEYIKDQINDDFLIENFIEKTSFIAKKKDSNEFDYKMSAGDAIIFDEGGVHKGSRTLRSERMVLRYLYSVNKN
tara:strand:+ start:54 stop:854 length:801 start_codon:yes stop_codon:yes gene_type:complete